MDKVTPVVRGHGPVSEQMAEAINRQRSDADSVETIVGDIVALSGGLGFPGHWNRYWYDNWRDMGDHISAHSHLSPEYPGINEIYSSIVNLSTAYSPGKQREVLDCLMQREDGPDLLRMFHFHCLDAEFAMELYNSAVVINEIRARERGGKALQPLPEDASFEQKYAVLRDMLAPEHYYSDHHETYRGTWVEREPFAYTDNYFALAKAELALMNRNLAAAGGGDVNEQTQLIVAGSGPLPLTALLIHMQTGANIACVDGNIYSAMQQRELINELERLHVVRKGALSVINENPAFIDYNAYIGQGLHTAPDGIIATYFARSVHDPGEEYNPDYGFNGYYLKTDFSTEGARPLSSGITTPSFNAPVEFVLHQAARAGAKAANIRDASGATMLLYEPFASRDSLFTMYARPVGRFIPDNKDHFPAFSYAADVPVTREHRMHNSSLGFVLIPEKARIVEPTLPEEQFGYLHLVTDLHLNAAKPGPDRESLEQHYFRS